MGFTNNAVPAEVARDPQRMRSFAAWMLGREAESSSRLDGETWPIETNPRAWMFDIDGTLTERVEEGQQGLGQRGWFEYERLEEDRPNAATVELAETFRRSGISLVFITARPEQFAEPTLRWLTRFGLVDGFTPASEVPLFMRPSDDKDCPDWVVKPALYRALIRPHWQILGVFDDSPECVDAWLDEGLVAFQPHFRKGLQ